MQAVWHRLAQCHLAVPICAATLLLKLVVPTGYVINRDHGRITIAICSGTGSNLLANAAAPCLLLAFPAGAQVRSTDTVDVRSEPRS